MMFGTVISNSASEDVYISVALFLDVHCKPRSFFRLTQQCYAHSPITITIAAFLISMI